MAVITISRQYGSGGDEIADRVGETLGYPHFDKSMITKAAAEAGINESEVFDYSEDSHKVRSFMDRLFNRSVMMTTGHLLESGGISVYDLEVPLGEDVMLSLVQKAIRSAYQIGNMMIMGRGSQVILQDKSKAVHIRIVAPVEFRIQNLKKETNRPVRSTRRTRKRGARPRIPSWTGMRLQPTTSSAITTATGTTPSFTTWC